MAFLPFAAILSGLILQMCQAASMQNALATHAATLHTKLLNIVNPSGLIPSIPSPFPPPNGTFSSTGYFYLSNSYASDCSNAFLNYGVPVNQCMVTSNYAFMFQIVGDTCAGGTIQYFLDTECTIPAGSTDLENYTDSCAVASNPVVDSTSTVYSLLRCTDNTAPPVTNDAGAVIIEYFDNSTFCDTAAKTSYVAFTSNECISIDNNTFTASCNNGVASSSYYDGIPGDCSGTPFTEDFPSTCQIDSSDDELTGDDGIYTPPFIDPPPSVSTTPFPTGVYVKRNGSELISCLDPRPSAEPTAAPTVSPTISPSAKPTIRPTSYPTAAKPQTATFNGKQVINGISYTTYSSNVPVYSSTLKQTIAGSMTGVAVSDITNFVAQSTSSDGLTPSLRNTLELGSITTTYTVTSNSVYTAEELSSQLGQAIVNGGFDADLHTNAQASGASGLVDASSSVLVVTYPKHGGDSNDALSDGAIAGIVIGCVAFVVIVGGLLFWFCSRSEPMSKSPNVEL